MHLAGTLLRADRLTISQVATRLGYESEASFSHAFKRFMGAAPGVYRRMRIPKRRSHPPRRHTERLAG
jgi:AraC-like DNA-binding protein